MAELEMQRGAEPGSPPSKGGKVGKLLHGKRGTVILAVIGAVVVGGYIVLKSRAGQSPAGAQSSVGAFPVGSGVQPSADVLGQQLEGLQSQIGNLTQQVSSVQSGSQATNNTGSNTSYDVTLASSHGQVWLYPTAERGGSISAVLQNNAKLVEMGAPVHGKSYSEGGVTSDLWIPVNYGGQTQYVWGPEATITPHSAT